MSAAVLSGNDTGPVDRSRLSLVEKRPRAAAGLGYANVGIERNQLTHDRRSPQQGQKGEGNPEDVLRRRIEGLPSS